MLSRSGLELNEIWARQANLVEADAEGRELERRAHASPGDAQARERALGHYRRRGVDGHPGLLRLGATGEVMAHHVREHQRALRDYNASREEHGQPSAETAQRLMQVRWDIRNHRREHGDHPATHVRRGENETPRQFSHRLVDFNLANSTVRPAGRHSGEHNHGTLTYDHDEKDEHGHRRNRDAMADAWEREVPEGYAARGDKTHGDGSIKGSYVDFRTGPRPRPRRHRRR